MHKRAANNNGYKGFKGNKASLPSKPCMSCGLAMSWRSKWAKNWHEVKYCSERCRRAAAKTPVQPT